MTAETVTQACQWVDLIKTIVGYLFAAFLIFLFFGEPIIIHSRKK